MTFRPRLGRASLIVQFVLICGFFYGFSLLKSDETKAIVESIYRNMHYKVECILTVLVVQRLVCFMMVEVWEAPFKLR